MNWVIMISTTVAAVATAVIAWYTIVSYKLSRNIVLKDVEYQEQIDEYRQQVSDLFQAIAISNLIDDLHTRENKRLFKENYTGETKIFGD